MRVNEHMLNCFFFNDTATTEIYTLSLHDALPIFGKRGSEVNDEYRIEEGKIITTTNYNGGILGGLSNGMPVEFRVVFKPTASIFKVQQSVNLEKQENTELQIQGRHDPCIALRAQVVVEAVAALAILDQIWTGEYYEHIGTI